MARDIYIKPDTYQPAKTTYSGWYGDQVNGTVIVQYGKDELTVPASKTERGTIYAFGFVGQYRTGTKVWPVSMHTMGERTSIWFGRDDRAGSFTKQNCISYAPDIFFTL